MSRRDRARVRDACRALMVLRKAPGQVQPAFELSDALTGSQPRRLLVRVRRSEQGAELLAEGPVVDPTTCDLRELLRLPFGTFGHEYAQWMIDHGLSRDVRVPADKPTDPDQRYLLQRILQVHDFWHVLSGYNCDSAGELGLLAFTYGQSVARGIPLVLLGVVLEDLASNWRKRRRLWSPLVLYLWRAFRRGRRAHFLLPILVEDYLYLPIGAVRQRLGIVPLGRPLTPEALPPIAAAA